MGAVNSFVSRVAEQALGRMIAQAPDKILSLLTSSVSVRVEISSDLYYHLLSHLSTVATSLGHIPQGYWLMTHSPVVTGKAAGRIATNYKHSLYLVRQRPVLLSSAKTGKDASHWITYLRGFDIENLLRQAYLHDESGVLVIEIKARDS